MSNNIIDITQLLNEFKDKAEIEDYCRKLYLTLERTLKEKNELAEKLKHLEELFVHSGQDRVDFIVSPEQAFIETQINRLKVRYLNTEINEEDCKKLESLMRSLKIAKEKSPPKKAAKTITLPVEEAELVALAATKVDSNGK